MEEKLRWLDREKVIKGLECHEEANCVKCPYAHDKRADGSYCGDVLHNDALALLKEQEVEKPKGHWKPYEPDKRGYTDGFTCSRCERVIFSGHYCKMIDFDFCPYCGAHMDNAEGW